MKEIDVKEKSYSKRELLKSLRFSNDIHENSFVLSKRVVGNSQYVIECCVAIIFQLAVITFNALRVLSKYQREYNRKNGRKKRLRERAKERIKIMHKTIRFYKRATRKLFFSQRPLPKATHLPNKLSNDVFSPDIKKHYCEIAPPVSRPSYLHNRLLCSFQYFEQCAPTTLQLSRGLSIFACVPRCANWL